MNRFLKLGPVPLVFLAFWLLLMVGGRSRLLRDPGTFWHTSVGERILQHGFFEGDPFTFSHAKQRWVPHQWLGEIIMALVHRAAGFDGFILLAASMLAAIFTYLTVRLLRTGLHPILVASLVGIALAVSSGHFHVRPLLMTMVGLSVVQSVLTRIDRDPSAIRCIYWLVPLFVLWTNIHGGMLGGWITLVLAGTGWVFARMLGNPSPMMSRSSMVHMAVAILLCGAAAFINPYGWEIPRAWLVIMLGPKIPQVIEEHRPLEVSDPANWCIFVLAAIYLLMLLGTSWRQWRVTWLIPLFWLLQSMLRVRHAPLFAVVTMIVIADLWPCTRWANSLARTRADLYDPKRALIPRTQLALLIPWIFVALIFLMQTCGWVLPIVGSGWAQLDSDRWPLDLLPTLRQHEPAGTEPNHLFNECEFGGFAIFYVPGYKVFVDDRAELYGDDWLDRYIQAGRDVDSAVTDWEKRYGQFHFALTRNQSRFDDFFHQSQRWECVQKGKSANFYRRK